MATLGEELRAIRHQHRLSLQGVEDKSRGAHKAVVVGSYERGARQPTVERVRELLAFYGGYRLLVLNPGDVVYNGAAGSDATVEYVLEVAGLRINCADYDEATKLAARTAGSRIGHRLIGPVVFDEPEAQPVENNRGGRP